MIFRKNDSATSLLMFVYNNYLTLNHKDSIKLTSLLEYMKAFGKNDSAVRMALSRAVKAGLLTNRKQGNEVFYSLTVEGKQAIQHWNQGVMRFWRRYRRRNEPWDGKWYFINLRQANEGDEGYKKFTDQIEQFGFVMVNSNTWVTPYRIQEEIDPLIGRFDLRDHLIEIHGEMTIHQNTQRFLDDKFNISHLNNMYQEYVNTFKPRYFEFKQRRQAEQLPEYGSALALLNDMGWNFFNIASNDAVLPRQLLGECQLDEATALFKEFREELLPEVSRFLNND